MKTEHYATPPGKRKITYVYGLTLFLMAITGFAQMPIFKRYYIADIPGLGWLAEFYTTHFLHYLGGVAILTITAYFAAEFILFTRRYLRLSASGALRATMLAAIIATGILLVIRNTIFAPFSPPTITVILLIHLGFTIVFLIFAFYCRLSGRPWALPRK